MLLAIGAPLPKTIFATGWLLNKDNEKMSKSRGSVMDPNEMKNLVGVEPLRYFLTREFRLGQDGPASHELIVNRVNTDLANNIGNLLSRTTNLIVKFFAGAAPPPPTQDESTRTLVQLATSTAVKVKASIEMFAPSEALEHVMHLLTETNRYLEEKAPWKTAKTDLATAGASLYVALEILRISGSLLLPVMPEKMRSLLQTIGASVNPQWSELATWAIIAPGTKVEKAEPLFPRVELKDSET
jgi:methionyl-tRNA synthetase